MCDGFNILAAANEVYDFICTTRRGISFKFAGVCGVCFLLKLAGYLRDTQGIFK
jgi:hypothetical protein